MTTRPSTLLARHALSSRLRPEQHEALALKLHHRVYSEGEVLVRQGEPAKPLILLAHGSAEVRLRAPDGSVLLATVGAGDALPPTSTMPSTTSPTWAPPMPCCRPSTW